MEFLLASNSPRRRQLLEGLGFGFEVKVKPTPEDYPEELPKTAIARWLAVRKAEAFRAELRPGLVVIAADTTVVKDGKLLEKPADAAEAAAMLRDLSGDWHEVITGVCVMDQYRQHAFDQVTKVHFRPLSEQMIHTYIERFRPFDKAGSYGIQEWIGMVGIDRIEGSYFNVMGLPTDSLYEVLANWA